MAKLYILRDENSSKKEGVKFNLFLNGYEVTREYCLGNLEGVYIQEGTYEIMLTLHSRFASWRSPQKTLFHVYENEDVAFVIKTSKALKIKTIAMYAQALFLIPFIGSVRGVGHSLTNASDAVVIGVTLCYGISFVLFLISALMNIVLTIYLVLMQKQQRIIEVARRIT